MKIKFDVSEIQQTDDLSLNPNKDKDSVNKSEILETVKDSVIGAANQFNILPTIAGGLTAIGFGADLPNKENLSFKEKFDEGKRIAQANINRIEDRSPIATTIGNAAGGIGLNFLGLPTGASAVNKGLQALNKGKDLSKGLKIAGDIVGTGLEGATQGYAFSRDEDPTKDMLVGAGIGSGLSAGGKAIAKGFKEYAPKLVRLATGTPKKQADLYAKRVGEIKQQKIKDPTPIQSFEDDLSSKITTDKNNYQNDMSKFLDDLSNDANKVNLERQQIESNIFDELVAARKAIQKEISKEAKIEYDYLSKDKMLDVNPVLQVIEDAFYKVDPDVDPSVKELEKFYNRLRNVKELNNGQLSEYDLKKYLNSVSNVAYEDANKVGYTPNSIRILRNVANKSRELLSNSNPKYAKQAKGISDKIGKLDEIEEVIDFNNEEKTLNKLKGIDTTFKTQEALKSFDEITGGKFGEKIKKSNFIKKNLDENLYTKDGGDLLSNFFTIEDDIIRLNPNNIQSFEKTLKKFDKIHNTKYADKFKDIRSKNNIKDVEKFDVLLQQKEGQPTRFRKAIAGLDIEDTKKPQTKTEKLIEGDNSSDFNRKTTKDQESRELIRKVSKYLGKDSKDVIRQFENEKLINVLDKGDPNGSKNVNVGTQVGRGLSSIINQIPVVRDLAGMLGGILGLSKDKGGLSRTYKGIVNFLDDVQQAEKNGGNLNLESLEGIPVFNPLVRGTRWAGQQIGDRLKNLDLRSKYANQYKDYLANKMSSETINLDNFIPLVEGRVAPIYTMESERQDQYLRNQSEGQDQYFRNQSGVKRQQNVNKKYFNRDPN